MKTFFLIILLLSIQSNAQQICDNQALIANGWVQHSSTEFAQVAEMMQKETQNSNWVKDIETVFFSGHLEKFVSFKSLDNLATYDLEMFGDVAFYSDIETGDLIEVRWYQDGKKHFVLRKDLLCTVDELPLAENTLF